MAFEAKSNLVRDMQLKVQELACNIQITGNATPASVVVAVDDPAVVFVKTEGTNKITSAAGALDSGETSPTFVAQVDANGLFSVLVKVGEPVKKVLGAQLIHRNAHATSSAKIANTTGISANGDKIVLDCDTSVDLSAANMDATLVVRYVISE